MEERDLADASTGSDEQIPVGLAFGRALTLNRTGPCARPEGCPVPQEALHTPNACEDILDCPRRIPPAFAD